MKYHSRRLAFCSMTAAISVTLMLVLGLTGIGTYAAPMLCACLLIPVRSQYGLPTALTVWAAVGLLSLLIVTDRELALVYLTMFGWYPAVRPVFLKPPGILSIILRYAVFNGMFLLTYVGLLSLLGMEGAVQGLSVFHVVFILLMNLVFYIEDRFLIPVVEKLSQNIRF